MKLISKSLALALAFVLILCLVPAANAQVAVLEPGETATFVLNYSDVRAIQGEIEFSDSSIIADVQYDVIGDGMDGMVENGIIFLYSDDPNGVDGKISITVTLTSKAPEGSSCTITIRYATTAAGSNTLGSTQTVVHSVTVPEKEETKPTEPEETKPVETQPSVKYADTTALKAQIKIAEELTDYEYTKETWAAVEKALDEARNLLSSTSQKKVDTATSTLKKAISDLVPVDYTALREAIDSVGNMENMEEVAEYWSRFADALSNAQAQLTSGDQEAVNAATEELLASWAELVKAMEEMGQIIEVEKIVEVEPSYPFCNIKGHKVIFIIMIISLVINAAFIALTVIHFIRKNRRERDDTPLVEYNIDDDMPEMEEDLMDLDLEQ